MAKEYKITIAIVFSGLMIALAIVIAGWGVFSDEYGVETMKLESNKHLNFDIERRNKNNYVSYTCSPNVGAREYDSDSFFEVRGKDAKGVCAFIIEKKRFRLVR